MVLVKNKPFLHHLISQSKKNGIRNFLILCGYKHYVIKKYFGSGKNLGVNIKYHYNSTKTETFKRLLDARHLLQDSFLLLYGDNYSNLDLKKIIDKKNYVNSSFLITICKKNNNGNVSLDKKKKLIKKYFFKKTKKLNYVEIGYIVMDKKILKNIKIVKNVSFNKFINYCAKRKKISYFFNKFGYKSISDIKRLSKTRKFFLSNKI